MRHAFTLGSVVSEELIPDGCIDLSQKFLPALFSEIILVKELMSTVIDLRSDFLSRPTPEMVRAMAAAAVESPVFESSESGPVRRLEEIAADMFGHETALFCPTVTICNQIAINILTSPGDTLVCECDSHIVTSEAGAPSVLSGVMIHGVARVHGRLAVRPFRTALQLKHLRPRLVVVENTHTRSGGTVISVATLAEIATAASAAGASLFLDGARLFNAACHLGIGVGDLSRLATMASISLGKGPGAPLGAVLVGERELIARAELVRKRLGGYWRPVGMLAAAGIVALKAPLERIAEDHANARRFAEAVRSMRGLRLINDPVETNLVQVDLTGGCIQTALTALERRGIRALEFDGALRFAFHHDVTSALTAQAIDALAATAAELAGNQHAAREGSN